MSERRAAYRTARDVLDGQMTESDFQRAITDLARLCGWLWWHDTDSRLNPAGMPDLILAKPGHPLIIAELKRERGRLRPAQSVWMGVLAQVPGIVARTWRPADWPEIERMLKA